MKIKRGNEWGFSIVFIAAAPDDMIIHGNQKLQGNIVNSHGDHRIGMMLAIASCIAEG